MNREYYLSQPPLPSWCAAISFRVFGFGETTARLIPVLAGAASTAVLYALIGLLMGPRKAMCGAFVWISTFGVIEQFRQATVEPYSVFFTLLCIWAWIKGAQIAREHAVTENDFRSSLRCILLFYSSLAFGFLAAGPLILLVVAVALAAFHHCYRWPAPKRRHRHLLGIVMFSVIALPWPIDVIRFMPAAIDFSRGALLNSVSGKTPGNALDSILFSLPWTPALIGGFILPLTRPTFRRHRLWPLLCLAATALLAFVTDAKFAAMPLLGAMQALIAIRGLDALRALARHRKSLSRRTPTFSFQHAMVVAAGIFVLLWLMVIVLMLTPQQNARSAKSFARELLALANMPDTQILRTNLPPEVAVYLPLQQRRGAATRLLVVVDNDTEPHGPTITGVRPPSSLQDFQSIVPDVRVIFADQVPMRSAPSDDVRWRVYELTVERQNYAMTASNRLE